MTVQKITHENPVLEHYHFYGDQFSCKVFPHLGGSIQELSFCGITIIKEIELDDAGIENYKIAYNSAVLFPYPNRIENGRYSFEEEEFQLAVNEPGNKNSIHGLVSDKVFGVTEGGNDGITMQYQHTNSPGFPFPFDFGIDYRFSENTVEVTFTVINTGGKAFPFGIGWHPYFQLKDYEATGISFSANKRYTVNENMIPVDTEVHSKEKVDLNTAQLDTAYHSTNNEVLLHGSQYNLLLQMPEDSFLQIYTPDDRKSVAIEPMSCIANAFNNGIGLQTLKPNAQFSWKVSVQIAKN
jgi:aldose 1-epimerase